MKLRTEIEMTPLRQPIDCREGVLLLGSCFTDHIGEWMQESWLPVWSNPFGVLFNPASIALTLERVIGDGGCTVTSEREGVTLAEREGLYYSFAHHGRFVDADPVALRERLLQLDGEVRGFLQTARHLIVTLGTAWVYERQGRVVANCHKFPASEFVRRRLTTEEILAQWRPLIEQLVVREGKHLVFTVSPIRHVKDSLHGNQLSKATLLLAIEALCEAYPGGVEYLPAYELLVDDLRDYRFYADDLVHPSTMAIEAVREMVMQCAMTPRLRQYLQAAAPLVKALKHRPSDPDSLQYQQFLRDTLLRKDALLAKY